MNIQDWLEDHERGFNKYLTVRLKDQKQQN